MDYVKRAWAEINIDNAAHNFNEIRRQVGNKAKLCCVVKADAYGHGAVDLSMLYSEAGADTLAVSNIDEAKELRENGIELPVLILGYTPPQCANQLSNYNISQTVYCAEYANELSAEAVKAGVSCKIHIKLDTGMSRLGFMCQEFPRDNYSIEEISKVCSLSGLAVEGIFTHFAVSDEGEEGRDFTEKQIKNFNYTVESLKNLGINIPIRHCANSGGIECYPNASADMVRAGIILYGLAPSQKLADKLPLKPVMTLKTVVSSVKELKAGATVSYGRTFTADKNMRIAAVPIGYADGYIRQYAEKGYMLVNGMRAEIVGRICMDQTMIDVTDIKDVKIGDEVIVFGDGSLGEPTVADLALWSGTINYEVLCIIGKRVPRLYIKNGKITDVMYKL